MPMWPAKKSQNDDDRGRQPGPGGAAGSDSDQLQELTDGLHSLGQLLSQANQQVLNYLLQRESAAAAAAGAGVMSGDQAAIAALAGKIDALAEKLDRLPAAGSGGSQPAQVAAPAPLGAEAIGPLLRPLQDRLDMAVTQLGVMSQRVGGNPAETLGPVLVQMRDGVQGQLASLAEGIRYLQQRLDGGLQYLAEQLQPPQPDPSQADVSQIGPAGSADWQRAILGADLAEMPGLEAQRNQLIEDLLCGREGACSLVGQLLVFRSAMTDKMPPLLKDIGEAYYRWQPKTKAGSNPMEQTLVRWLMQTMQDAGIPNTIELVHPGERFDSTRHNANSRGVEITEVCGWIVLRDNGKVYTKAAVAVK